MNIKKCSLKVMCAALAGTMFASTLLPSFATEAVVTETPMEASAGTSSSDTGWTTEENSFENIKVTYQQSSSYTVTIPKTIALDTKKQASYSVKVSGDIDANQRVYVAPLDGIADSEDLDFYMKDLGGKKADVAATVTQNKVYWNSEDVENAYEENNNSVSAPNLTAGTWEGTFQIEIRLETENEQEHIHNYVDGICDGCGSIDPNHTHHYEDGTCTICGKEQYPYETAPVSAYSNWNYTLDDENNIITLNYYKGAETNVIVYANYVIGGKTYKTQLASNPYNDIDALNKPYMFNRNAMSNCLNILSIKFSKDIDTSNVTDMSYMFYRCSKLVGLDISGFDTSNVTDMSQMFYQCNSLTSLDVSNFDTGNVTKMTNMFGICSRLTSLNVSNFDTSNVTDMAAMFMDCSSLTSLDVSNFDTSKVTNMTNMFNNIRFSNLDLHNFDTSNVTNMTRMFQYCSGLTSLDLSNFDTSNVTTMNNMFSNCSTLTSINLSNFDTSNVTDMSYMFAKCADLTSLDLSSFDTHNATDMSDMFYSCNTLSTIYATEGKWSTTLAESTMHGNTNGIHWMFYGCGTSSVTYK